MIYGQGALVWWQEQGFDWVEFWCVGTRCEHRHALKIADAIARFGPGESLVMLARRSRCALCQKRGCHVQAVRSLPLTGWSGPQG